MTKRDRRNRRWAAWSVMAAVALVVAALSCPGCAAPQVGMELGLAADDLRDAATMLDAEERAETIEQMRDLAAILDAVGAALADGGPSGSSWPVVLDAALDRVDELWEAVQGEPPSSDVRAAVFLARATLRRVRAYAAPDEPVMPEPGEGG